MIKRTLLSFLRSYLTLLLGVAILIVPLYIGTISLFEKRQIALINEGLQSGIDLLDQQVASLNGVAYSLSNDSALRSYAVASLQSLKPSDYYALSKIQHELYRSCLAQPYVTDYGIMLKNELLLTGERLHFPDEQYYGAYVQFGDMGKTGFFDAFAKAKTSSFFQPAMDIVMMKINPETTRTYRGIVWLCSLSPSSKKHPNALFYATISQGTLAQLFLRDLDNSYAGFVLQNSRGEELLNYGLTPGEESRRGMHVIRVSAAQTGLSATLFLSPSLFPDMMIPVRNLLLLFLCVLLLCGVLLSVALAWRSSRPVRSLLSLIDQSKACPSCRTPAENSYEAIGNAVSSLLSSVDSYRSTLASQQIRLRDNIFDKLLHNTFIPEDPAFQQHAQEFQYCFPSFPASYRLSLISLHSDTVNMETLPQNALSLCSLVETMLSPIPYIHLTGWKVVLVLDASAHTDWTEPLEALKKAACEQFDMSITIVLSDVGDGIEALSTLYRQTKDILNLVKRTSSADEVDVWQKQHFPHQQPVLPVFYTDQGQLYSLIRSGEKEAALALLGRIHKQVEPASLLEERISQQVYADLYSLITRLRFECGDIASSPQPPLLQDERDPSAMFSDLQRCIVELCDLFAERREPFPVAVCRFIDEHLSDSALSAAMVADHFSISQPTLQKIMRQQKNCSLYNYVVQKRYEMSITLLKQTDVPINAIAAQCGFGSVNSFYKVFKRMSSISPSNVRMNARSESFNDA